MGEQTLSGMNARAALRLAILSALLVAFLISIAALIHEAAPTRALQQQPEGIRFAIIGDYGTGSKAPAAVAQMVQSWKPDFIVTTGDNNYPDGEAKSIDKNVGQFYHSFIFPYKGKYGAGADRNRFFPILGNHDWHTEDLKPYLDYFTLPGNERYYSVLWGPVEIFAVDSDPHEPDGITADSVQGHWLKQALRASTAPWKLVFAHHPPYSSGDHGSTLELQWPFKTWGATAVFSGHEHSYERLVIDGFPYFINGLGGAGTYDFKTRLPGSEVRYNASRGAMLVEADREQITFQFFTTDGKLIDSYTLTAQGERVTVTPTPQAAVADTTESAPAPTLTPTPATTPAPGEERIFAPVADARVEEANPSASYGYHSTLRVDGGTDPGIDSYLKFSVAGINQPVVSAKLRVYASTESAAGLSVVSAVNNWDEGGSNAITWATRPTTSDLIVAQVASAAAEGWIELDVSSVVTGSGTYTFVLKANSTDGLTLSSREGDDPPQLVLTF